MAVAHDEPDVGRLEAGAVGSRAGGVSGDGGGAMSETAAQIREIRQSID